MFLKLHRTDVTEKGVASNAIIEHFNILEDFMGCLSPCMEQRLVNELDFQGCEEALGDSVDAPMSTIRGHSPQQFALRLMLHVMPRALSNFR